MSTISRREFLAATSLTAGAMALTGPFAMAEPATVVEPVRVKAGTDVVTLGKTEIETSVLGIGTGTVGGREQRELGKDGFVRLAREAFDRGVRYIDTADMYKIHPFVGAAVKELPRDKVFVQTKTMAKNAEKARADIDRFRRELGHGDRSMGGRSSGRTPRCRGRGCSFPVRRPDRQYTRADRS